MGVDARFFDLDQPFLWTVPGVLTGAECAALIERAEAGEWLPGTVSGAGGRVVRPGLRSNMVALIDDPALGAAILSRIKVPPEMSGRALSRMKTRLRCYRYQVGQSFGLHRDQKYRGAEGERSELTVLVYLNADFSGGRTDFPEVGRCIMPEPGLAVVFQNMTLHAGERVSAGTKYLLRGDVFYREMA